MSRVLFCCCKPWIRREGSALSRSGLFLEEGFAFSQRFFFLLQIDFIL